MRNTKHIKRLVVSLLLVTIGAMSLTAAPQNPDWKRHLALAKSLFESNSWVAAASEIEKTRALAPATEEGLDQQLLFMEAVCCVKMRQEGALDILHLLLDRYPNSLHNNEARFYVGSLEYNDENYTTALANLLMVNPSELSVVNQNEYWFKIGHCHFVAGQYDRARSALERIPTDCNFAPHATYFLGYMDYLEGDYKSAGARFKTLGGVQAYAKIIPFYLIQIEFLDGNYKYVVENGDALIASAEDERKCDLNRIVGESYFHLANYTKCLDYMSQYKALGGKLGRSEYYVCGFANYKRGNFRTAAEQLAKVCGPDDELSQNASYHLADCYLQLRQKQLAKQSFSIAAAKNYNPTIAEDALYNYGKLQYELGGGHFNEAINVLGRYIKEYPTSPRVPQVREYLIAAYYNSHNYKAAYDAIMQIPNPDNNIKAALQKITYFHALEYYNNGDVEQAERLFKISEQYRYNAKYTALSSFWQGEILYSKSKFEAAIPKYKAYLKVSPLSEPENPMAHYSVAYCNFNLKKWDEAAKGFATFLARYKKSDSYRADAFNRQGDIFHQQRSDWKAIESYDGALRIDKPQKYYAEYQRAMMLGLVDRPQRKIESLEAIVAHGMGNYQEQAIYELGRTYIRQDMYAEGARTLEKLVDKYPTHEHRIEALSSIGLAYLNTGDNDKALKFYKQVIAESPNSNEAQSALTTIRAIYVDINDVDSYFAYAEKSGIETDISVLQRDSLKFTAAEKIYLSGNFAKAVPALEGYIESYPNGVRTTDATYYLGDSQLQTGDKSGAIEQFQKLAQMTRNEFTLRALERLTNLTVEMERYSEAAEAYRMLSRVESTPAKITAALDGYVDAVIASKDTAQILALNDELEGIAEVSLPAHRKVLYTEASILRAKGQMTQAEEIYMELAEDPLSAEGAEATYRIIEAQFNRGNYEDAHQRIIKFSEANTSQMYWLGKAFLLMGDIYAIGGDSFQARATYQSIVDGYSPADDGIIDEAQARIQKLQ